MFDQITTVAEIDEVSMEVIASIVQTELIQASTLAVTIADYSQFAVQGANAAKIPSTGSFTVTKKQAGQKAQKQKLTFSGDSIPFTEHAVVQGLIEDIASIQSNVPVAAEYLRRMASAHALQVDVDLFAQIKQVSSQSYTTGSTPTKKDFTKARKVLRQANVPLDSQLFCAFNATNEKEIMDLADFVDADKWLAGSEAAKLEAMFPGGSPGTGFIGRAYGCNLISTNVIPDSDNGLYFYHSSHAGIAFQLKPRIMEQYMVEYLGLLVSMDQLYGVKVLDGGVRGIRIGA